MLRFGRDFTLKSNTVIGILCAALCLVHCGAGSSTASVQDSSVSGVAASSAGGALSASSANGTLLAISKNSVLRRGFFLISSAYAAITPTCPTFGTTGTGCSTSGNSLFLTYSDCSYFGSAATLSGYQALTRGSGGVATCGNFPLPAANGTFTRQIVEGASGASSTTPGTLTLVTSVGTEVTVDHATANLGNFNGDTISALSNSGYGNQITYNGSQARSAATIKQRLVISGSLDHSVSGSVTIAETTSTSSTRILSGSLTVYHNLLKIVGTATFKNVTHSNSCCLPISGNITTTFAAGSNVAATPDGAIYIGKSETLDITGCGSANFTDINGTVTNVSLDRCI